MKQSSKPAKASVRGIVGAGQQTGQPTLAHQLADGKTILQNHKQTILISLKVFDETAAIRMLVYSNNFVDLPKSMVDQLNKTNSDWDENFRIRYTNELIQEIQVGSVLSLQNASTMLVGQKSLQIVLNLDNKYSKLQVYNRGDNTDQNDLANFLSDLSKDKLMEITGSRDEVGSAPLGSRALVSNYDLVTKQLF